MTHYLTLISIVIAMFLGGCGQDYRVQSIIDTSEAWATVKRTPESPLQFGKDDYRVFINPYTYAPNWADSSGRLDRGELEGTPSRYTYYEIAAGFAGKCKTEAEQQAARNMLQNAMFRVSDEMVIVHLAGVRAIEGTSNFALGTLTTGLAGAAAVVVPPTAAALAAGAAGTNSVRALSNEQYFRNLLTENVYSAIYTRRSQYKVLVTARQQKPIKEYDVEAAIADATCYHEMGSFLFGLSVVRSDIEVANAQRLKDLLNLQKDELERSLPPSKPWYIKLFEGRQ